MVGFIDTLSEIRTGISFVRHRLLRSLNLSFIFICSSPQINPASFSFGAPGESSMSSAGALQLGLSEEGTYKVH